MIRPTRFCFYIWEFLYIFNFSFLDLFFYRCSIYESAKMSKQYLHIFFLSCVFTFSINAQLEMKLFGGLDTMALKQHFGKKIMELGEEKRTVQVIGILKLL